METSEESKSDALESNALLSEILGVLKRIDTHLENQEGRIRQLEANKNGHGVPYGQLVREESLHQENRTERKRNLTLHTRNRNHRNNTSPARSLVSARRSAEAQKSIIARNIAPESPKGGRSSIAKIGSESRAPTWGSQSPPPTTAEVDDDERAIDNHDFISYSNYPPPQNWVVTRSQGRVLDVKYNSEEARELWKHYLGDSCTVPPDGRIELTFQKHILERLEKAQVVPLLENLQNVSNKLEYQKESDLTKRGSFKVTDYDFDPNFEESVAEYRADIPVGQFRKNRVKRPVRRGSLDSAHSAPWKRIIEVRGLSKKLIDGHETWTSNFRDPWNEALPVVNSICPFLTNRSMDSSDSVYAGMQTIEEALLHHQQCWRRPPRCDEGLCFHITFYELIDIHHESDLEGEIWRSGRLHSDNEEELVNLFGIRYRRIRESACTVVAVADLDPEFSHYWTLLNLCPNTFELYDKTQNFEQYDIITNSIKGLDVTGAFAFMVEFSVRMVILRWEKIAEYFAWLVGHHRDILSDPDAHDSLLFDDDSFSRSRRYFWAINYLAELDNSISGNIVELEKFAKDNQLLREQLSQLQYVRGRLRAQREDAIALRDGVSHLISFSLNSAVRDSDSKSLDEKVRKWRRKKPPTSILKTGSGFYMLFSASGVMESRASTRLGENVKLLTFSIWSVNDAFSLKALAIVAVLVGLGTYVVVFNLNNVAGYCSRTYLQQKSKLVEQMKNDSNKNWNERAKQFESFRPKNEKIKPSDWLVVSFMVHKIFGSWRITQLFWSTTNASQRHNSTGNMAVSVSSWADLPLPWEAPQTSQAEQTPTVETEETKKKSSIRGGFARLSLVFRRGAFSTTKGSANR